MPYHHQIRQVLTRLTAPQRRWEVGTRALAPVSPSERQRAIMSGLDAKTIRPGRREVATGFAHLAPDHQPRAGAGQQAAAKKDPAREALILARVAPPTAGDPMSDQKCLNGRLTDSRQHLQPNIHAHQVCRQWKYLIAPRAVRDRFDRVREVIRL